MEEVMKVNKEKFEKMEKEMAKQNQTNSKNTSKQSIETKTTIKTTNATTTQPKITISSSASKSTKHQPFQHVFTKENSNLTGDIEKSKNSINNLVETYKDLEK